MKINIQNKIPLPEIFLTNEQKEAQHHDEKLNLTLVSMQTCMQSKQQSTYQIKKMIHSGQHFTIIIIKIIKQ